MGNTFTYDYKTLGDALLPEYDYVETQSDERFGRIGIFVLKADPQERDFFKVVDGEDPQIGVLRELCERRIHLCHQNLLKLIKYPDLLTIDEISSSGGIVAFSLLFETWDSTLAGKIVDYIRQGRTFSEEELSQIFYACTDCLSFMQALVIPHGFLVPESILYVQGVIKLAPHSLLQGPFDIINKKESIKGDYVAPEVLTSRGTSLFRLNMFKADVFSLGVVLLRCALLHNYRNIYDEKGNLDQVALMMNLIDMEKFYSKQITDRVKMMLSVDPASRPDPLLLMKQYHTRVTIRVHTPERIVHNSSVQNCRTFDNNLGGTSTTPFHNLLNQASSIIIQHPNSRSQAGMYATNSNSTFHPLRGYSPARVTQPVEDAPFSNWFMDRKDIDIQSAWSRNVSPSNLGAQRQGGRPPSVNPSPNRTFTQRENHRLSNFGDQTPERKTSQSPMTRPSDVSNISDRNTLKESKALKNIEAPQVQPSIFRKSLKDNDFVVESKPVSQRRDPFEGELPAKQPDTIDSYRKSPSLSRQSSEARTQKSLPTNQLNVPNMTAAVGSSPMKRIKYSIATDISENKDPYSTFVAPENPKVLNKTSTLQTFKVSEPLPAPVRSVTEVLAPKEVAQKPQKGIRFADNIQSEGHHLERQPTKFERLSIPEREITRGEYLLGVSALKESALRLSALRPDPKDIQEQLSLNFPKDFETKPSVGVAKPLSSDESLQEFYPPGQHLSSKSSNQGLRSLESERSERDEDSKSEAQVDAVEEFPDGSRYEGKMTKGVRNGYGKFTYPSGGYYEGNWIMGKMEGFGRLFYPDGMVAYEGYWQDEKFHGRGILINDTPDFNFVANYNDFSNIGNGWSKYEGEFWNDAKEGNGICYFSDGSIYEGKFKKDKFEGEAKFQKRGGNTIFGLWSNNKLVKEIEQ